MHLEKIISGGQTGVDRAALDVAISNHIPHGGWCPRGRKAEDGVIADHYSLRETETDDYRCRTEWNVRDADATLVLCTGVLSGGTALTVHYAREYGKPCLVVNLDEEFAGPAAPEWLKTNNVKVLNVAGPRESNSSGIYQKARRLLQHLIDRL